MNSRVGVLQMFVSEKAFARPCPLLHTPHNTLSASTESDRTTHAVINKRFRPAFLSPPPPPPHHGPPLEIRERLQKTGANGSATGSGPRAICGFQDGSLSVVDAAFRGTGGQVGGGGGGGSHVSATSVIGGGSGAIPWASKAGHIETVFSCEHRPGDPDTLATGSYGSSVKVWHVPTMDLKVGSLGGTLAKRDRETRCECRNGTLKKRWKARQERKPKHRRKRRIEGLPLLSEGKEGCRRTYMHPAFVRRIRYIDVLGGRASLDEIVLFFFLLCLQS